jgi:hypothetical protein
MSLYEVNCWKNLGTENLSFLPRKEREEKLSKAFQTIFVLVLSKQNTGRLIHFQLN